MAEQTRKGNQPPAWWMGEDRLFCRLQFGQLTGAPGWCRDREQARKRERESRKGLTADKRDKNRELCIDLGIDKERKKKNRGRWGGRERETEREVAKA